MIAAISDKSRRGFTLIELLVVIAIIGVLTGISVPLANSYRVKAEYISLQTTLRYLMDGMETYYIDNDAFYPEGAWGFSTVTVNPGEAKDIPELKYNFPAGHKHKFVFLAMNFNIPILNLKWNYSTITVSTDFDYDRNGVDDQYIAFMQINNNKPVNGSYRVVQRSW